MARKFVHVSRLRMLRDWDRIDDEWRERNRGFVPPDPDRSRRQRHQRAATVVGRLKTDTRAEALAIELVGAMLREQASRSD